MNRTYKVVAAFTSVVSIIALGACGGENGSRSNEITVWGGVQADQGMQAVIDGFEKKTGISVRYTRFVNDTTGNAKLDTALMAGEPIDVFFTYTANDLANRSKSGIPEDLSSLDKTGFLSKYKDRNVTINNKIYGIPASSETNAIIYNETAFDKLGITIPKNWSWDDFKEIAKKATYKEKTETVYGLAGDLHSEQQQVLGADAEYSNDGKNPNFTNPGWGIKQYYYDMVYKDKSAYPFSQVMARNIYLNEYQLLLTGNALMSFYLPWMSRTLSDTTQYPRNFKLGFAPLPKAKIPGVQSGDYNAAANNWMQINSKSKNKENAWKFIKYIATDGAGLYSRTGKLPVFQNQIPEDKLVSNILGNQADSIYDVLSFKTFVLNAKRNYLIPKYFVGRAVLGSAEQEEEQSYYLNSQTYGQYISNLTKRFEQEMQKQ